MVNFFLQVLQHRHGAVWRDPMEDRKERVGKSFLCFRSKSAFALPILLFWSAWLLSRKGSRTDPARGKVRSTRDSPLLSTCPTLLREDGDASTAQE